MLFGLANPVEAALELEVAHVLVGAADVVAEVVLVAAVGELGFKNRHGLIS
jgi:hypothetical protein